MRKKSRTSAWSKPRRELENVAADTSLGDDGSGREIDIAISGTS
jgi:hypothetical protein